MLLFLYVRAPTYEEMDRKFLLTDDVNLRMRQPNQNYLI